MKNTNKTLSKLIKLYVSLHNAAKKIKLKQLHVVFAIQTCHLVVNEPELDLRISWCLIQQWTLRIFCYFHLTGPCACSEFFFCWFFLFVYFVLHLFNKNYVKGDRHSKNTLINKTWCSGATYWRSVSVKGICFSRICLF